MTDEFRIGVIGLRFGQLHVQTIANLPGVRLVAVADRNPAVPGGLAAYAANYGATAYHDGIEMLENEQLDGVSLCVSPGYRRPLIEKAAQLGIALLVEKPWAANVAEAESLAALCARHKATVMVGFSFRYHPAVVKLKQLINGELGAPWLLNGEYLFGWLPPAEHWLWQPEGGNGFFNENSCHLLDAVCYLLGEPVSLFAETGTFRGSPQAEVAAVTIRFASGASAALTLGCLGTAVFQHHPRLDLVAENGQAHLAGRDHMWESLTWATHDDQAAHTFAAPPEQLSNTRYTAGLTHFVECVRNGRLPSATVQDGVRAVRLAMAIGESAASGKPVLLGEA